MEHQFQGKVTAVQIKSAVSKKDNKEYTTFIFRVEELSPKNPQFPEAIALEFFSDKLQCPKEGDNVTVDYNIKSNVWEGKIYGSNQAWKIAVNGSAEGQPSKEMQQPASQEVDDGLPF